MQNYCNIVKNKLNMLIWNMEKNVSDFVIDPKRDFVCKSELSFSKTMRFILGMGSQTLGKELMEFYDYDPKMVSVSAVVQRRAKILPAAFQYLFHKFNEAFSQTNFFHGYRLYAVDGSDIHIPTIPDDKETFYRANDDAKGYNLMHLNTPDYFHYTVGLMTLPDKGRFFCYLHPPQQFPKKQLKSFNKLLKHIFFTS